MKRALSVFIIVIIFNCSSCKQKSDPFIFREGELKYAWDKRFYNTVWQVTEYKINGIDQMDSIRKYQFFSKFLFGGTFYKDHTYLTSRSLSYVDTSKPANWGKYKTDTTDCRFSGSWGVAYYQSVGYSMRLDRSLYLTCTGESIFGSKKLNLDSLFPFDGHWLVLADNETSIMRTYSKYGNTYTETITKR